MNGVTTPCATAALGLLNFAADSSTTGRITGTVFQYDIQNGERITSIASGSPETFALASSTGRVTVGNASANPSVLYLASPASNSEPVTFFIVGTDSAASFGYAEQGATAPVADASLNGSYFVVNDDSGDSSVWAQLGVIDGYAELGSGYVGLQLRGLAVPER